MLITLWTLVGALTGFFVSSMLTKYEKPGLVDVFLGVLGAVVGGQVSLGTDSVQTPNTGLVSLFVAIAGATVSVVAYRVAIRSRRA